MSAWDVSAPIFVKGRHFGAFRVAVSLDSIAQHKHALLVELAVVFGFLAAVTVGFIFVMLRRSMRPLEHLAHRAAAPGEAGNVMRGRTRAGGRIGDRKSQTDLAEQGNIGRIVADVCALRRCHSELGGQ